MLQFLQTGKTTFFRQFCKYKKELVYTYDPSKHISMVHWQVISSVKEIMEFCGTHDEFNLNDLSCKNILESLRTQNVLYYVIENSIQKLLSHKTIQKLLEYPNRSMLQIPDSFEHFCNRLSLISKPDYSPTFDDILKLRIKSTGIHCGQFDNSTNVKIIFHFYFVFMISPKI